MLLSLLKGNATEKYSYPETLYKSPEIPDYSSFKERKRLSGPSLRQFFKITKDWKVCQKDARFLLGGITNKCLKQLSLNPEGRILNRDQLLRVTTIIAIDNSLRNILDRAHANRWAQTTSRVSWLCGRTPLSAMVDGGILTMWELRRLLEALASNCNEAER
jgi:hypothetical protein